MCVLPGTQPPPVRFLAAPFFLQAGRAPARLGGRRGCESMAAGASRCTGSAACTSGTWGGGREGAWQVVWPAMQSMCAVDNTINRSSSTQSAGPPQFGQLPPSCRLPPGKLPCCRFQGHVRPFNSGLMAGEVRKQPSLLLPPPASGGAAAAATAAAPSSRHSLPPAPPAAPITGTHRAILRRRPRAPRPAAGVHRASLPSQRGLRGRGCGGGRCRCDRTVLSMPPTLNPLEVDSLPAPA